MATPQPCAQCGAVSDTAQRCTGCLDGSEYLPGNVGADTFYCSKACQQKHWPVHKADCEKITKHKQVFRFSKLLKDVFMAYREKFYEHDILKIEIKDNAFTLSLDIRDENFFKLGRSWKAFPAYLAANNTEREAALTIDQCGVALALLGPLARKLMRGTGLSLQSVMARIHKPVFQAQIAGFKGKIHTPALHGFIRVINRRTSETWVVDPTAAQYGIRGTCFNANQYGKDYGTELIRDPQQYTENETKDLEGVAFLYNTQVQMDDWNLECRMRRHFATFVANNDSISKDMFRGTNAEFDDKLKSFLTKLKLHLAAFN